MRDRSLSPIHQQLMTEAPLSPYRTRCRSPGVSLTAFTAHLPNLQPGSAVDTGLRGPVPARPTQTASYSVPVRQVAALLPRFLQTAPRGHRPCASLALCLHQTWAEDLHLRAVKHARHTRRRGRTERAHRAVENAQRFPRASTGLFPSNHPRKTPKGPKIALGNPDRPRNTPRGPDRTAPASRGPAAATSVAAPPESDPDAAGTAVKGGTKLDQMAEENQTTWPLGRVSENGCAKGGVRMVERQRRGGRACCVRDDSCRRSAPGCGRDESADRAARQSAVRSRRSRSIR